MDQGLFLDGPQPVRTPAFPMGIPDPSPAQQSELRTSALLHERARHFLSLVAAHGGPVSSGWTPLSKPGSPSMRPTAATWLPVNTAPAWAFWCNFAMLSPVACKCRHPPRYHQDAVIRMAPSPRAKQPATRMLWLHQLPLALHPSVRKLPSLSGRRFLLPHSSGRLHRPASKMEQVHAAPPSGALPTSRMRPGSCRPPAWSPFTSGFL